MLKLDLATLRRMIRAWASGTAKEAEMAASLETKSALGTDALTPALTAAVLTAKGEPRKRLATKAAQAAEPEHAALDLLEGGDVGGAERLVGGGGHIGSVFHLGGVRGYGT